MRDLNQLANQIRDTKLAPLLPFASEEFVQALNHGMLKEWLHAIDSAPTIQPSAVSFGETITIGEKTDGPPSDVSAVEDLLRSFIPWRKGPFSIFGIEIDTEWDSAQKWARLVDQIEPLENRKVLDVGSGNGYYTLRMIAEGAACAIGIDPHLPYVMQFWLLKKYLPEVAAYVLPLTLDQMPLPLPHFDTVFSMGVIYHRRSPIDHLMQLKSCLRPGGQLVIESIVVEGKEGFALTPKDRYARMSNVWFVPSSATLMAWLDRCGFTDLKLVDESKTTLQEQRKTSWMPFGSLDDALTSDGLKTIEGYPAPLRAVITASKAEK